MIARTWPYGTRKTCKVESVSNTSRFAVLVAVEGDEAYLLLDVAGHFDGLRTGQDVVIEFRSGGPLAGFWDVAKG